MRLLIFRKEASSSAYQGYDSLNSNICFLSDLFKEGWFNQEFLNELQKTENKSLVGNLVVCTKEGKKVLLSSIDVLENNLFLALDQEKLCYIIKEFNRLQNLSIREVIYLFEGDRVYIQAINHSESCGIASYQGIIKPFGMENTLTALIRFLIEVPYSQDIFLALHKNKAWNNNNFSIKTENKTHTIYHFDKKRNSWSSTILPKKALSWIFITYRHLIHTHFEEILFYRTPEKYVFMKDIGEEITCEI